MLPPQGNWAAHWEVDITDRDSVLGRVIIFGSAKERCGGPSRPAAYKQDTGPGVVQETLVIPLAEGTNRSTAIVAHNEGIVTG